MWHEVALTGMAMCLRSKVDTTELPRRPVSARVALDITLLRAEVGDPNSELGLRRTSGALAQALASVGAPRFR
jgi:hypothetical protein